MLTAKLGLSWSQFHHLVGTKLGKGNEKRERDEKPNTSLEGKTVSPLGGALDVGCALHV